MGDSNQQLIDQLMDIAQKLKTEQPRRIKKRPEPKRKTYRRRIEQLWLARYHRIL